MKAAVVNRLNRLERDRELRADPEQMSVREMARRVAHIFFRGEQAMEAGREPHPAAKEIATIFLAKET